jgi:hypothetical protein
MKAAVQDHIRQQYRMFSNFGLRSLDEMLFEDGTTTLGDTLTANEILPF